MATPTQLTPMLRHYLEVKAQHPDALLFYRMGDFYELFFEDAQRAAPLLEVALTARGRGTENEAPMCGVPYHALETYLGKVLRAGLKAAVCDQMEDPATAKGMVRREVTRVITPGTLSEPGLLDGKEENLLASVRFAADGSGAVAFLDISTGAFFVRRCRDAGEALEGLELLRPRELLASDGELPEAVRRWAERSGVCRSTLDTEQAPGGRRAAELVQRQLGIATLKGLGLEEGEPAVDAAAAALVYARDTQRSDLGHVRALALRDASDALLLDPTTLANLEVLRSLRDGGRRGTLLAVLDRTLTPAGGRLIKEWLRRPLRDAPAIRARHDAVGELLADPPRRERLREALAAVGDLERWASRAVLGTLTAREAAALRDGLGRVPAALAELATAACTAARVSSRRWPRWPSSTASCSAAWWTSPPATLEDGGVIADGVDSRARRRALARPRQQAPHPRPRGAGARAHRDRHAQGPLQPGVRLLPRGDARQPAPGASRLHAPPDAGQRRALRDARGHGARGADPRRRGAPARPRGRALPPAARRGGRARRRGLRRLAETLAAADVLAGLAEAAARQRLLPPALGRRRGRRIVVREGRHPVVERAGGGPFVPNDLRARPRAVRRSWSSPAPTWAGKSTYLRQVALIVLMAQAGSFVPAARRRAGRGGPHLHPRRRQRRPRPRRVHLHGGDDRDRAHPAPRHRR